MEKYIYDEKTGLHYELIGDYYYPCLAAPEPAHVGVWGMWRHKYLREHQKVLYTGMLLTGKLNAHLEELDRSAEEMFSQLVKQLSALEGVTESLKAASQMGWVSKMNSIHNRATEIVFQELIYA